jgi:hypothetical protein
VTNSDFETLGKTRKRLAAYLVASGNSFFKAFLEKTGIPTIQLTLFEAVVNE